ncbi:hypothetical protein AB0L05_04475 [Nonomuraea pusilla]|uniref:hypothetical protein n=1 Tax=Nonomuraea pusilla TaxID=46177 RepID=UPI00332CFC91
MPIEASTVGRKGWLVVLPGQVAAFGSAVCLIDLAAIRSVTERLQRSLGELGRTDSTELTKDVARYGEVAMAGTRPVMLFFAITTILFASVVVPLWRGSRHGVAVGLFGMGFLAPAYLAGLFAVSLMEVDLHSVLSSGVFEGLSNPDWYPRGRAAVLGAAAMACVASLCLLARPATTRWQASPAPRMALLLMSHLPLVAASVTVLNFVAIDQTRRLAAERVRTSSQDEYAGAGEFYLAQAFATAWRYAPLLAVAGVIALVLTVLVRRYGVTAPLLVGLGVVGLPLLFLLLLVSLATPFVLSGAGGEPVPEVLGTGPNWYPPAIFTQVSLAALAYVVTVALMLRAAGDGDRLVDGSVAQRWVPLLRRFRH